MPTVIRQALHQKVAKLQELRQFREDFALATGLHLEFVDELCHAADCHGEQPALCNRLHACEVGRRLCQQTHARLIHAAHDEPACLTCDAGLHEVAVPVRVGDMVVGFLRFAGIRSKAYHGADLHRIEHLLQRSGVAIDRATLEAAHAQTRLVAPEVLQAYVRILAIAAQQLAVRITQHLADPTQTLPPIVERACKIIRRRALTDDLHLGDVAEECGVSPSHLSRAFHHATGLTFREYVSHWRIVHAQNLLHETDRAITDIAFDCGFQSLSQFNRVFRAALGKSPRQVRAEHRRVMAQSH
jgi:AraC-like DNA-binding protein/ligand-binding sensor protein